MRTALIFCFILVVTSVQAQVTLRGVIADSATRQPLPFATVQALGEEKAVISKIDGKFNFTMSRHGDVRFSYTGHRSRVVSSASIGENDTIFLTDLSISLEEVIVRPHSDKINRIINAAIQNKGRNNPEQYKGFECNVYYKMIVDMVGFGINADSMRRRQDSIWRVSARNREHIDTAEIFDLTNKSRDPSHWFITETYSQRLYKKPQKIQENILASKISGISKTWFANMITDILPFHIYSDYISLNNTDYISPISKGWQQRYKFVLEDEMLVDNDTVFILRYNPRPGISFNSLSGLVYINSDGYAVSHFTGTNNGDDLSKDRVVKFEHIYQRVNGKWFPQELNYDFAIRRFPLPYFQLIWNGHSIIDHVVIGDVPASAFDKAHPVKFSDSIDLRTEEEWRVYRKDTLLPIERNTYRKMDSLIKNTPLEGAIFLGARFATGRFPIGKFDVDVRRILASNGYEGTRLGLGLYTNNKISKYYSIGGWFGYGFKDDQWKYGASVTVFPKGDKDNWLSFSWQKNYKIPGEVNLHPELSRSTLRNWLLEQVDEFEEFALTANIKPGYWEIKPSFFMQEIAPLHYPFEYNNKFITSLDAQELSVGFRYAYGEKRIPYFEYYVTTGTKYPILYFSLGRGKVSSASYETRYNRLLAAVSFYKHLNRWGNDQFRLEGGWIASDEQMALPKSFLMAGNGYRRSGFNFFAWGGFLTMLPFEYYSDRYVSLLYKHDFDKDFWDISFSKPYLSLAHNMVYGSLQEQNKAANFGLRSYGSGYQESGIVLNRLVRYNLRFAEFRVNTGAYYHWTSNWNWKENGVWVIGVSLGF